MKMRVQNIHANTQGEVGAGKMGREVAPGQPILVAVEIQVCDIISKFSWKERSRLSFFDMKLSLVWTTIILGGLQLQILHAQSTYEPYAVQLFAGATLTIGADDGVGTNARFNGPEGVALDASGNVYVADTGNYTIRKITPAGAVTTFAGFAGSSGSTDGTAAARFELVQGVCVDGSGNVYVSDSTNDTIRKITSDGVVTTFAGAAHQIGSTDGAGSIARFSYPIGIAVDAFGNVYVADNGNSTIRMITPAGFVTTLAGLVGAPGSDDGTGSGARFNFVTQLVYDSTAGVLYAADTGNDTIRQITLAGAVTTLAGSPGNPGTNDGTGSAARFSSPRGVAVDRSSNVYVADTPNHTIRKIRPGGIVTTLAGSPGSLGSIDSIGANARFNSPYALVADRNGHLYVADTSNHTIRLTLPAGEVLSIKVTILSNGHKLLTGRAFPNIVVSISATGDLSSSFQPLVDVMADSAGNFQYEDTATIKRFYRASVSGG